MKIIYKNNIAKGIDFTIKKEKKYTVKSVTIFILKALLYALILIALLILVEQYRVLTFK